MTKGLFAAVHFTYYIISGYQEKIIRHAKKHKTQFEETGQVSKPTMAGFWNHQTGNL